MIPKPMVALSLTAVLALAGQPAQARGSHHGGGGGRSGGSHGVSAGARSAGTSARSASSHASSAHSYSSRSGVAERRHPRAGTGGYYRPSYGGYYRPYGRGYGRPLFRGSIYFGWPYYPSAYYSYPGYYAPYYGYGYGYAPYYGYDNGDSYESYPGYGYPSGEARGNRDADRPDDANHESGRLQLEVRPDDATVYVDDEFRGTAREATSLVLAPGRHLIELVRPGFAIERREVTVVGGQTSDVLVELQRR